MLTSIDILRQLKDSYNKGLVSALVGAGFTQNMYEKALGWKQLLRGVVIEAYGLELRKELEQCNRDKQFSGMSKSSEECIDDFVDNIIKRDGYLGVVSSYIKFKGCREAIDVYIEDNNPFFIQTPKGTGVSGDDAVITDDKLLAHKAFLECNWQHIFTTNYDNALEYTSHYFNLDHNVITHDYDLSSQKLNHSIIKIHGSLVDKAKSIEQDFEFDNDKSIRYIISESDYRTYPERHQAFSYLLRIAMLAGTYCLIGFSGDDPNFLSWLDWVKDILDKDNDSNVGKETIKVFLVSIDKKTIGKAKQLFYKNHHIGVISLWDADVQKELCVSTTEPSISNLFQSLFAYLSSDNIKDNIEIESNTLYTRLWRNIYSKVLTGKESIADELVQIEKQQGSLFFKYVSYQETIYESVCNSRISLNEETKHAFLVALNDLCKPIVLIPDKIKEQIVTEPLWSRYEELQFTLLGNPSKLSYDDSDNNFVFQNILRCFYQLDYNGAKNLLNAWIPKDEIWICRKSSLNYLFDKGLAIKDLGRVEKSSRNKSLACFAYSILKYVDFRFKVDNDKYRGVDGISEQIYHFVTKLRQPKIEICQYGKAKNRLTNSDVVDSLKISLQFFKFMTDNGLNPTYSIVNAMNIKDWYLVFRNIYEYYPWACLYYSVQYNDKKVLARIGQDYAYSLSLSGELSRMLKRVLEVLTDGTAPVSVRSGLLCVASRMFIAVKENEYFNAFRDYLQRTYFQESGDCFYSSEAKLFVASALNSLSCEEHISEILTMLLRYYLTNESDAVELVCDHLRWKVLKSITEEQKKLFYECVAKGNLQNSIFLLLRFSDYRLMPEEDKENVIKKYILGNKEALHSLPMYQLACVCIFVKKNIDAIAALKEEILRREVWGPKSIGGIGGDETFFRFSMLPAEFCFSEEEEKNIAEQLQSVFYSLEASYSHAGNDLFKLFYDRILHEMDIYVNKHKRDFGDRFISAFHNVMTVVNGFGSLYQAFYGDTAEMIEGGIREIYDRLEMIKYAEVKDYYAIAIDRLLIKQSTSNTELLSFAAKITKKFKDEVVKDESIMKRLLLLLLHYDNDDLRMYDFEVVNATQSFRTIAKILKDNGADDLSVNWWLDNERNLRYNYMIDK